MSTADDAVSSVGWRLQSEQVYSLDHPEYRAFADRVEEALAKVTQRETVRLKSARALLCTTALDLESLQSLAFVYPEFDIKVLPLGSRVHALWHAHRLCANEWLSLTVDKYATKVVHYGGNFLSKLIAGEDQHHVEFDKADEVSFNEAYIAESDAYRIYGDVPGFGAETGMVLRRSEYEKALMGKAYGKCAKSAICSHSADAVCVDMSLRLLSPQQVALSMMSHSATLALGYFIYHPSMLVSNSGVLSSDGVSYIRTEKTFEFLYPEGRASAESYDRATWARWLASHAFKVTSQGDTQWFQLELLKNREAFMFFRMVRVAAPSSSLSITHALDLPESSESVLVKSWRLKDGLRSDPDDFRQWEPHWFVVPRRVVDRVSDFAMQLKPENFSRFAIKKQIRVVNNRWVVTGVMVVTAPSLEPQLVEDLTTAIFAKSFADRYESSQLSSDMMKALKSLMDIHGQSTMSRLAMLTRLCAAWVYDSTLGKMGEWMSGFADYINQFAGDRRKLEQGVSMSRTPEYFTLTSAVNTWRSVFRAHGEVLYSVDNEYGGSFVIDDGGMAGALTAAVSRFSGSRNASITEASEGYAAVVRTCTDVFDTSVERTPDTGQDLFDVVSQLNPIDSTHSARMNMEYEVTLRNESEMLQNFLHVPTPDPVHDLNQLYGDAFPSVADTSLEFDTFSLSLDPQDRTLAAPYLKAPKYFGLPPAPKVAYRSRLKALNVPKRQNTNQELLTAILARNTSAPQISTPQIPAKVIEVWENFLNCACRDGQDGELSARALLLRYQSDPVALAEDALKDWSAKAKPGVVDKIVQDINKTAEAMEDMRIDRYHVMLKADVKPTLSVKPVTEVTAPQVIVYHEKPLSALYSSIFRVLVRRFLSLLKPNYHINLLKDNEDIGKFITDNHDFGSDKWHYLENDFSKFDKSQSQFAFDLEYYVFQQLGMNQEMLEKWLAGHVNCDLHSMATGLSLHVLYQRKSGDATTAFGNVILNALAVTYAYRDVKVSWAVFMGDDSIVCTDVAAVDDEAVKVLAEVFNLTAKYYVTKAPYFASSFIVLDRAKLKATMMPDPIKRIEKLSMHVSADDPQWDERYASFVDSMQPYTDSTLAHALSVSAPQRYDLSEGFVRGAASALGTLARDKRMFRSLWEQEPETLQG